jgi:hypothetical protein
VTVESTPSPVPSGQNASPTCAHLNSAGPAFEHGQQLGCHPPGDVAQRPQLENHLDGRCDL